MFRGKVSIVAMLGSMMSEEHVNSYTTTVVPSYLADPAFQYVQINVQENPLKAALVSLFIGSQRRKIAPALHSTYLLCGQNLELVREDMGMQNKLIGASAALRSR